MDDAVSRGASICAFGSATAYSVLAQYPTIKAVKINSNQVPVLMQAVRDGECDAALLGQVDWLIAQGEMASNPDCNLVQVGDPVRIISGSW
jgi:ABC-type amino acid transport substrate-binding protein